MTFKNCPRCEGNGWLTRAGKNHAEAAACDCVTKCKKCRGQGLARVEREGGFAEMIACPCGITDLTRRIDLYNRAQIPPRFFRSQIDRYQAKNDDQATVKQTLLRIRDSFVGDLGIGLHGPPGVGKTHLLTALAGWMTLIRGKEVVYADFSNLVARLRAGFDNGIGENRLIEPIAEVQVLMIDELGKGRATEWERGVIDRIISHRYNAQLPTFYATNYAIGDMAPTTGNVDMEFQETLKSRLGSRVWSRLQEMSSPVYLGGQDFRVHEPNVRQGRTRGRSGVAAVTPKRG